MDELYICVSHILLNRVNCIELILEWSTRNSFIEVSMPIGRSSGAYEAFCLGMMMHSFGIMLPCASVFCCHCGYEFSFIISIWCNSYQKATNQRMATNQKLTLLLFRIVNARRVWNVNTFAQFLVIHY